MNKQLSNTKFRNYIHSHELHEILNNIVLATDSYKLTHWKMYKTLGITHVYSFLEARANAEYSHTVWFGLKYFLEKLEGVKITKDLIDASESFVEANVGQGYFNRPMWEHIVKKYGGKLPVIIKSIPEGSVVPVGNVLLTIQNDDPECVALVNHLESLLLQVWYPCTVATISKNVKDTINYYKFFTGENKIKNNGVPEYDWFTEHQLLDFGYRGASSVQTAAIGGLAHMTNFLGSDTIAASLLGAKVYNLDSLNPFDSSYSVPATEHSIMTSLGRHPEYNENELIKALILNHNEGILSLVMDSYDIYSAIQFVCSDPDIYKHLIKTKNNGTNNLENNGSVKIKRSKNNRGLPGKIVFRPDSGEPVDVIPKILSIIENSQYSKFITTTSKGYKLLPPCFGILWGDGMNPDTIENLLWYCVAGFPSTTQERYKIDKFIQNRKLTQNSLKKLNSVINNFKSSKKNNNGMSRYDDKWAINNFLFGMGGGLLQKVNRDTQSFAFKCSANKRMLDEMNLSNLIKNSRLNNRNSWVDSKEWLGVVKDPITDKGKKSKKGRLILIKDENGNYITIESIDNKNNFNNLERQNKDLLKIVFNNGDIMYENLVNDFSKIKKNILSENVQITKNYKAQLKKKLKSVNNNQPNLKAGNRITWKSAMDKNMFGIVVNGTEKTGKNGRKRLNIRGITNNKKKIGNTQGVTSVEVAKLSKI